MKAIRRSGICTLALYLLCSVTAGATPSTAQAPNKRVVEKLAQGKPLVREIGPGETHVYKVAAPRKHVITGTIQQQGVDVVVRVVNPRGVTVSTNDSPNGAEGPEPWSFEAKAAGTWRIEVSPWLKPSVRDSTKRGSTRSSALQSTRNARPNSTIKARACSLCGENSKSTDLRRLSVSQRR